MHGVLLDRDLPGIIAHNPRSNMNNSVGYARPARFTNPVVLGTDGIGADMLEEFRLAYARLREDDMLATPEDAWRWLEGGYRLVPEAAGDQVTWSYDHAGSPWHLAFTTDVRPVEVVIDGEVVLKDGVPPGSTPTRYGPAPPSRRRGCSSGCERPPVTTPVALYLQDAHPIREAMGFVQRAEARGFDAVWQADSRLVRECCVPMAAFGAVTERIRIGSGVVDCWTRNPARLAATFSTLDDLAPGRIICGIGAWWDPLATKVGVSASAPADDDARGGHGRAGAARQRDGHLRR